MKQKKKSLKLLLESDFRPLEEKKEGQLLGGFGALSNNNCNCNCECHNDDCPCSESNGNCNCNCACSNDPCSSESLATTTSMPSSQIDALGMFGFF